jgi:chemotaxis signal transduction protein
MARPRQGGGAQLRAAQAGTRRRKGMESKKEFVTGVGRLDDKLVVLLNADAIPTADEKEALATLGEAY